MATHSGNEGEVYIGANQLGELVEFQVTERGAIMDDSQLSDEWDTHLGGSKSWEASLTCQWDEGDTNGQEALTVLASVTLNLYAEGNGGGNDRMYGTATVEEVGVAVSRNNTTRRTFRVRGNGALTHTTV